MITTLFFLQLIAFQIWYVTSSQTKQTTQPAYVTAALRHTSLYRGIGIALMLLTTIAFVVLWGWMTGICASLVGLMTMGNLLVALNPFRYINAKGLVLLYVFFLVLEFLV